MSKMSQLHAELSEQAYELGFESLGEAEQAGYGVDWENHKLLSPQEAFHKAWLEEKQQVLNELVDVIHDGELDWGEIVRKVEHAIDFIEKGEM